MATLRCPCGKLLNNHADNNETEGYLITNQNISDYDDSCYAAEWATQSGRLVWECHNCGRLAFDWEGPMKWYLPEDGQPGRLMARTRYEIENA